MAVSVFGNKMIILGGSKDEKNIWTSRRVDKYIYNLQHNVQQDSSSPFFERKIGIRKGELNFYLTPEEEIELERCMNDVIYFADKYCFAMTDEGVVKITLRDYQKRILREFQNNRFNILMSARQSGKTIISSFFLTWYMSFHADRNALVISNRAFTMREIMDKVKVVYRHLPFFLKPGAIEYNKEGMSFDNGCKIVGESTSETPALGFTIHLLYADEFAHIPENLIEPFYRSIYPTLSSSLISKMIITSTPNGFNKFHTLYTGAWKHENEFVPIKVDWWEVPGRDAAWKKREIGNLGSIEAFNQLYGNQFLSGDRLLLDIQTLQKLEKFSTTFKWRQLTDLDNTGIDYQKLLWSPSLKEMAFNKKQDKFVITVDIADGVGKDYSVINIFRLEPMSIAKIRTTRKYKNESAFFRLKQIGVFRSNVINIEDFSNILSSLIFDVFGVDLVRLILEVNFKGDLLIDKLSKHREWYDEILLHTKHSQGADYLSPGVKLNRTNKPMMCNEFSYAIKDSRIVITEELTTKEAMAFGLDKKDNYSSQLGHDDIIMTCINLIAYLQSSEFYDDIEDIVDNYSMQLRALIDKKLQNVTEEDKNSIDYGFLRDIFNS